MLIKKIGSLTCAILLTATSTMQADALKGVIYVAPFTDTTAIDGAWQTASHYKDTAGSWEIDGQNIRIRNLPIMQSKRIRLHGVRGAWNFFTAEENPGDNYTKGCFVGTHEGNHYCWRRLQGLDCQFQRVIASGEDRKVNDAYFQIYADGSGGAHGEIDVYAQRLKNGYEHFCSDWTEVTDDDMATIRRLHFLFASYTLWYGYHGEYRTNAYESRGGYLNWVYYNSACDENGRSRSKARGKKFTAPWDGRVGSAEGFEDPPEFFAMEHPPRVVLSNSHPNGQSGAAEMVAEASREVAPVGVQKADSQRRLPARAHLRRDMARSESTQVVSAADPKKPA